MVLACCSPSLSAEVLVQVVKHRKQLTQPLVTTSQEELLHYLASCLVMDGVDIRTVQELMGHETLAMTVRYAHLSPGPLGSSSRGPDHEPASRNVGHQQVALG